MDRLDQSAQIEYYLIDEGWEKWPDSWKAIASDVAYAKTKNVKIWIWVHSRTVWDSQARRVLPESGRGWSSWNQDRLSTTRWKGRCELVLRYSKGRG